MSWSVHKCRWCAVFLVHRRPYALQHIISLLKSMYRALLLTGMKYYGTRWNTTVQNNKEDISFQFPPLFAKWPIFAIHFNEEKIQDVFYPVVNNETSLQIVISVWIPLLSHLCVNFLKKLQEAIFFWWPVWSRLRFSILFGHWTQRCVKSQVYNPSLPNSAYIPSLGEMQRDFSCYKLPIKVNSKLPMGSQCPCNTNSSSSQLSPRTIATIFTL